MNKVMKWGLIVALVVLVGVALCCGLTALVLDVPLVGSSMATAVWGLPPTTTPTAMGWAAPTRLPTPTPPATLRPAALWTPTASERYPTVLAIEEARVADGLTAIQWEAYTQQVIGTKIHFAGDVIEVWDSRAGAAVLIADIFRAEQSTAVTLFDLPLDFVVTLSKGDPLRGHGTVVGALIGSGGGLGVGITDIQLY